MNTATTQQHVGAAPQHQHHGGTMSYQSWPDYYGSNDQSWYNTAGNEQVWWYNQKDHWDHTGTNLPTADSLGGVSDPSQQQSRWTPPSSTTGRWEDFAELSPGEEPPIIRMTYDADLPVFATAHNKRRGKHMFAMGSYLMREENKLQVIEENMESGSFHKVAEADVAFPVTKLMWEQDLLAGTGQTLRLWRYYPGDQEQQGQLKEVAVLNQARTQMTQLELPPLTSFHWCPQNRHKLGTSSVDTTCTIWNLEKQKIETQLIAHDRAVYDIAFSPTLDNLFSSVGADGSVRLFDQKNLDHSTIIYESSAPLLRLAWNEFDTNLMAAVVAQDGVGVIVLDIRKPSMALTHMPNTPANSIAWMDRAHLLVGSNDGLVSVFDVRPQFLVDPNSFSLNSSTNPGGTSSTGPVLQPGMTGTTGNTAGAVDAAAVAAQAQAQAQQQQNALMNTRARNVLEYDAGANKPIAHISYFEKQNLACIGAADGVELVGLPPISASPTSSFGGGICNPYG
ncbi:unnamed protein product [Amoebophrya sp. A120]|nr:unnamed protein product [Amoebophrya sp. A120]|eukprot:GSA120T00013037001.1